jgi:DNA recombination protein RmuC
MVPEWVWEIIMMQNSSYWISAGAALLMGGVLVAAAIIIRLKAAYEGQLAHSASENAVLEEKRRTLAQAADELRAQLMRSENQSHQHQVHAAELSAAHAACESQVIEIKRQLEKEEAGSAHKEARLQAFQEKVAQFQSEVTELSTVLAEERKQADEKIALLNEAREQLKGEFQNLAQKIFEEKSRKFTDQNRINMDQVVNPLREQLGEFKRRVEDVYDKEARDRRDLHAEINHLKELNQRISKEALNLTRALKGDSKARGNWGEVILERVLEASGLQKGREYDVQVSLKDTEGKRYQPDVVVRLPQGKDVIIDAKVSLKDYEAYYSAEDLQDKAYALKNHVEAMRTHLRALAGKSYEALEGVRTLDFVLMFVPIEAAFLAAVEKDRDLFNEAFEKNIMVVCPSTLLVTLRTIENIWRNEHQNRHALEIAKKAGGLYDKFVGFVEALEEVGQQLDRAKGAFQIAHDRLARGRGNLVQRTQELKTLGVKAGKELPQNLIEMAQEQEPL